MLRKAFDIALLYLDCLVRSPAILINAFLMPLIFTFIISQSSGSDYGPTRWQMNVVNEDTGTLGQTFINYLTNNPALDVRVTSRELAMVEMKDGEAIAALVIPPEFSSVLLKWQTANVEFYPQSIATQETQLTQQAVRAVDSQLAATLRAAEVSVRVAERVGILSDASPASRQAYFEAAFAKIEARWKSSPPVSVEAQNVTRLRNVQSDLVLTGAQQSSPGMLVMFSLFLTTSGSAMVLLWEREMGTLRRLLIMPVSKASILIGKLLGIYISGIFQIGVLILAGVFLFKVDWGQSPLALIAMVLSYVLTTTSLGILMATMARTPVQANALSLTIIMAISALGGAWWPIEIVPAWMRTIGYALPTAWAMSGFEDIIRRGLGINAVLNEVGMLSGLAIVALLIGIWRFRYE